MRRFIYTIVASLGLHLANFAAPALAQDQTQAAGEGKTGVEIFKRSTGQPPSAGQDSGQKTPAIPYAVALLSTIIVMVIVCTPSRKRELERR
jgi:hypothetical protein